MSEAELYGELAKSVVESARKGKRYPPREPADPKPRWGSMPICERCWVQSPEEYQDRFPLGGGPGNMVHPENPELICVRQPVRFKGPEADDVKQCGFCGFPTWAGIFIRQDLNTIDFPPEVDN